MLDVKEGRLMANILPVPESEQRVLDNLLRDLNETYPDKMIVRLQQDHKKWYEKLVSRIVRKKFPLSPR